MKKLFELLIPVPAPTLDRINEAVHEIGGQVRAVSLDLGTNELIAACSIGLGSQSQNSNWVVLADAAALLEQTDFNALGLALQSAKSAIWLQPWNDDGCSDLFAWQSCGPRVGALWSGPGSSIAVCLNRTMLQERTIPILEFPNTASADPLWELLICLISQGHEVAFPTTSNTSPWKNSSSPTSKLLPLLVPDSPLSARQWLKPYILPLKPSQLVPGKRSDADAVALKAGICQWHDWLDDSHQLSQSIEGLGATQAGDYWHAIMHRREPDYANAKYWFRQLGTHSVFTQLGTFVAPAFQSFLDDTTWSRRLLKGGAWDPFAFVDLCEACASDETQPLAIIARQLQAAEMQLLLAATYRNAIGMSR